MGDATFPGAGWEGFIATRFVPLSDSQCQIDLIPDPQVPARCPRCRRPCSLIHDTTVRRIRDRDLFEYRVWLSVPIRRVHGLWLPGQRLLLPQDQSRLSRESAMNLFYAVPTP